jgi:predicted alpha/beta superfamily hydrolase
MKNHIYTLFTIIIFITKTLVSQQIVDSIPKHQTFTINSITLNENRVINVWIPENYENSSDSLPVIYMADGGIKEDFPHIANTLADLINQKKIKPIILVGIENTQRRRDLTSITEVEKDKKIAPVVGGLENFKAFIKEELFIEINKRYKTTNKKSIIGESLAGLFVMEIFFSDPSMFDNYIAFDPSLWWNNHKLINTANENLVNHNYLNKKLWFAGSNTKDISRYTKKLEKILTELNSKDLIWKYSNEPNDTHQTIFRATKVKALEWSFN